MRKLTKKQSEELGEYRAEADRAHEALAAAIESYNEEMKKAWELVDLAKRNYEAALEAADAWRDGVHDEMESYQSERSERWEESDAGQEWIEWADAWGEEIETEVDLDEPDPVETPDPVEIEYPEEVGS